MRQFRPCSCLLSPRFSHDFQQQTAKQFRTSGVFKTAWYAFPNERPLHEIIVPLAGKRMNEMRRANPWVLKHCGGFGCAVTSHIPAGTVLKKIDATLKMEKF